MRKNLIRFDWAIKRLLRNKANFGILEGFLSELLGVDIKIKDILEGESNKEFAENKLNRVDLLVTNTNDELIIIEIQGNEEIDYLMRMAFAASKLMVDNAYEGMEYQRVKKIISINIVYFDFGHGKDYIYHGAIQFEGLNKNDKLSLSHSEQKLFKATEIEDIYPEFYIIKVNNFDNISKNTLDEWINFLKNEEIREGTVAKGLKEAKDKLDVMKLSTEERKEYESHVRNWHDSMNGWNNQFKNGKEEGIQEGMEKGEMKKAIEIARSCFEDGMSLSQIAKLTGLGEDEIRKIKHS